jgi:predicted phosphate transport protein (TIGR00153 family)
MKVMEKRGFEWFEKRSKTKGLDIAHEQIMKAVDTVILLNKAMISYSENKKKESDKEIQALFVIEEKVDALRTEVFKELSTGSALVSDYREDLLHLVKRLDTIADNAKDAARCLEMLGDAKIPDEMLKQTVLMTSKLVESAQTLKRSVEKISEDPAGAINEARRVAEIEHEIDKDYLSTKALFVKYGREVNIGAMVIFDDMIEFIEQASDLCADTADYIFVLSSRE